MKAALINTFFYTKVIYGQAKIKLCKKLLSLYLSLVLYFSLRVHLSVYIFSEIFLCTYQYIFFDNLHKCYTLHTIQLLAGINIFVHPHVCNWVKSIILISYFDLYFILSKSQYLWRYIVHLYLFSVS